MKNEKVFLLLSGEEPKSLPNLSNYGLICATDGGYNYLAKNQIKPDFIAGDFDSVENIPDDVKTIHTPNQDFTDFHKTLDIIHRKGYKDIDVYGASGKEQDHFLGNLSNAVRWRTRLNLTFFDNYGKYFLVNKRARISNCKNKTVSLIPFPFASQITTKGLEYSLTNEDLIFGDRIGTRNRAKEDTIEINFTNGELFVFINDRNKN